MSFLFYPQLPGYFGTRQTIMLMTGLVNRSYRHPWIQRRADRLRELSDYHSQHVVALNWVASMIEYREDPEDIELLSDPVSWIEAGIEMGQPLTGDCDDMATYLATLLKAADHNPQFRIIAADPQIEYHHVYIVCEGVELDPTFQITGQIPGKMLDFSI